MRSLFAVLLLGLACSSKIDKSQQPAVAPPAVTVPAPANEALRDELLAMTKEDQRVRREWINNPNDPKIKAEAEAIDKRNQARVIQIVDQYGWPGKTLVGQKASGAAWLILQHSNLDLLHRYLPVMQAAADKGELEWSLLATTIDRVRINEGRPQIYGTQFKNDNGKWVPYPIEDESHVDERRKQAGLQPLAEYTEALRKAYETQPKKP